MKHLMFGTLAAVLLSTTFIPIAKAETVEVNPAQLISLAQNGYLADQGIPSSSALTDKYQSGDITAREIVQAAIADGRLTPETLNNRDYLNAVNLQLRDLLQGNTEGGSHRR